MNEVAVQRPWAVPSGREPSAEVDVGPNRVALLKDGRQAYPAMLEAIRTARSTVCLETYIYRDDTTGLRFAEALMERARAGVQVLLMFDYWGSSVSDDVLFRLGEAGVKLHIFKPLDFTGSLGRLLVILKRRNHRKALIVDGQVAFTGGLNISNEYAATEDGGLGWRDTHVRIVGPAAQELERLFLSTWNRSSAPAPDWERFRRAPAAGSWRIRILGNDFADHRKDVRRAYLEAMSRAKDHIFLTHAYFLPPSKVLKAMVRAARRGVRVAVILAAATDVKLVLYAARGLYPKLLRAGVEVWEWQGRVLHAKTAVVDGHWCTIGSSNLDPMSLRQNLEVNAVIDDTDFAAAVERMFVDDLGHCERVTKETIKGYGYLHRLVQWLAFRVRHWL